MSKIGKQPIDIPEGVTIKIENGFVSVKGPKGELSKPIVGGIDIVVEENLIKISPKGNGKNNSAKWGLQRALINNMVIGVAKGFEKILEFKGVGYKASMKGDGLELGLGYSHPVIISGVEGIMFSVEKSSIKVSGIDKELIGRVAANIRSKRPPEPYKGSGIKYSDEIIRRKAGKKATTTG